jgi:hypothetical protein
MFNKYVQACGPASPSSVAGEFCHTSTHPGSKSTMGAGSIRQLPLVLQVPVVFFGHPFSEVSSSFLLNELTNRCHPEMGVPASVPRINANFGSFDNDKRG